MRLEDVEMPWKNPKILNIIDNVLSVVLLIVIGINVAILLLNQHTLFLTGG